MLKPRRFAFTLEQILDVGFRLETGSGAASQYPGTIYDSLLLGAGAPGGEAHDGGSVAVDHAHHRAQDFGVRRIAGQVRLLVRISWKSKSNIE